MAREIIRVEPLSTYLERWKAPASAVTRHGGTIYVSGFPPFDPETGDIVEAPIERQTEIERTARPPADARHRRIRVVRDYGMFDRREAPQYHPEVKRIEPRPPESNA